MLALHGAQARVRHPTASLKRANSSDGHQGTARSPQPSWDMSNPWCPHLACVLGNVLQQRGSSDSPGCADPWDGTSGWGDAVVGTCCSCWDPSCSRELSHRRRTRATSAWPPGSQWGCATLAMSSLSRMSSRWVALSTGDTRLGCGMSGCGCAPPGKGSNGRLGPSAVGTAWVAAGCVAVPCQPCAWRGAGLPRAGGVVVRPQGCPAGWDCCSTAA